MAKDWQRKTFADLTSQLNARGRSQAYNGPEEARSAILTGRTKVACYAMPSMATGAPMLYVCYKNGDVETEYVLTEIEKAQPPGLPIRFAVQVILPR